MAKQTRRKAHPLPAQTKKKIGLKKERFPEVTYSELAEQFGCTYDQARQAHKDHISGRLEGRGRRRRLIGKGESDATLTTLYNEAVQAIAQEKLTGVELTRELERLVSIRKTVQQIELTGHIKRIDAGVIARLIRRYEPSASDDRVLEIYYEELRLWQASL